MISAPLGAPADKSVAVEIKNAPSVSNLITSSTIDRLLEDFGAGVVVSPTSPPRSLPAALHESEKLFFASPLPEDGLRQTLHAALERAQAS